MEDSGGGGGGGSNERAETITDIQNYLASFNKEIQDGASAAGTANGATLDAADGAEGHANAEATTTYYVAQSANGTAAVQGYQYDQSEAPYGTTYYASSDGTYYAATTDQSQADAITAFAAQGGATALGATVVPVATPQAAYQAVTTAGHTGLQQIVLAVSEPTATSEAATGQAQEGEQQAFVAMPSGSGNDAGQDNQGQAVAALVTADSSGQLQSDGENTLAPTHTIRMLVRQSDGTESEQTIPVSSTRVPTLVTSDGQEIHVNDEGTLQMMATLAEQAAAGGLGDGNNQVILNVGNTYQTVTVVPTDGNQGEMGYMLILSQSDDDKDGGKEMDLDMSVYDFNEGEKQHGEIVHEEVAADGTKTRTIRITQKKSQIVTQAHMCNYCNYTSSKRYLLSRHMKSHSEERPHKCGVCERGFKTLAALQNHVNTHTGTRPHCCRDCESSFTTSGELVRHVRYRHTHEKPHRCTECDYASVELSKLKRHMRCHTGERPYQCPHCTYASPDMYKLKRHLRIHTGEKPYECDICQARFTQSNSLKAHKLIHSGNKPSFHCEFCPTTCGRKTDLRIHMQKLHTSDKPLKCKRCGKTFPDRYSYKLHSKTHEGEKCFKCDLCPYASISQRHLESHMLIHTDQKPFRCDECDQAFRQKQLLRRHKNLYHDPNYVPPIPKEKTNECSECGKAFRHKGNLIRHLAIHDPEASAAEKAEALRIGEPKGPGEQPDGEEDYYVEEEEDEEEIDGSFAGAVALQNQEQMQDGQEGEQVVVFEVIQFPTQEAAKEAVTSEDGITIANGEGGQLTILRDVADEECFVNSTSQPVVEMEEGGGEEEEEEAAPAPVPVVTPKRPRGRPRKYPLMPDAGKQIKETKSKEEVTGSITPSTRGRKRRNTEVQEQLTELSLDTISNSNKRLRPVRSCRLRKDDSEDLPPSQVHVEPRDIPDPACDAIELARREAELTRRRLQQKEKDMAECFGFNDDEEETETILAMPAVPGSQNMSSLDEKPNEVDSGSSILLSIQNHNESFSQLT